MTYLPRIMVAAPQSGGGKTTVTCALLGAMGILGKKAVSFKCGPDYVDPLFHREVLGVPCSNLDVFLMGEGSCTYVLGKKAEGADIAVIEGVMGYYDGVGQGTFGSSYHVARVTETPVILVINGRGMSLTLAAIVKGMADFRADSGIKGVILNQVGGAVFLRYKEMIERESGIPVLGYMPEMPECRFESRKLGLAADREEGLLEGKLRGLAEKAAETIDWEGLFLVAGQAAAVSHGSLVLESGLDVTIAVARDEAFCFLYHDALDVLRGMGAEIVWFSPLRDARLPCCDGLILGGGYPERYVRELNANASLLAEIRERIREGVPCWAESGGFMVLFERIKGEEGRSYEMAGVIQGEAFVTKKLNRFGYVTLTAKRDNLLCRAGEKINAHEFHYSDTTDNGGDCVAVKPGWRDAEVSEDVEVTVKEGLEGRALSEEGRLSEGGSWECVFADERRFMGFPHIHLLGNVGYAESFLRACREARREREAREERMAQGRREVWE